MVWRGQSRAEGLPATGRLNVCGVRIPPTNSGSTKRGLLALRSGSEPLFCLPQCQLFSKLVLESELNEKVGGLEGFLCDTEVKMGRGISWGLER